MKNDILEKELISDKVIKYIATANNSVIDIKYGEDFPDLDTPLIFPFIYILNREDLGMMTNYKLSFIKKGQVKIDFDRPMEGVNILMFFC